MSSEGANPEAVLHEGYTRFNAGEVEWLLEQCDPRVVWEDAPEIPGAQTYRGREGVRRFLESFGQLWEEIRFEPVRMQQTDDGIVVFCRLVGRGRSSGAEVTQRVGHVWEFTDLAVVRVRTFLDWEGAAQATGAEAPEG